MRRYGFFRELSHGDPTGLSIKDVKGPVKARLRVSNYLENAPVLFASPGLVMCVAFNCDAQLVYHVSTDGVWSWPMDLAHYVRFHGVAVPQDMLVHIEAEKYKSRPLTGADLLALEP